MKYPLISASILNANFLYLKKEIDHLVKSGADYLHVDVMDGRFVNNISFGFPVFKSFAHAHHLINDVHIMIEEPLKYAAQFVKAGAHILTFHYEATKNEQEINQLIKIIKDGGAKAGISIRPQTPIETILPFLDQLDLVLIMSVEPGFGGQSFDEHVLTKMKKLRTIIDERKLATLIEIDGGINEVTAKSAIAHGAHILVVGSYLFTVANMKKAIKNLKESQ